MNPLPRLALCFSMLAFACAAQAQDYTLGALTIGQPWSQALPPNAPTVAAYFTLANAGAEDDVLLGVDSPIAGQAQMHQHIGQDGMMKMQRVTSVLLPAAGQVNFAPMAYHVMLLDLGERSALQPGQHFPLTLHFQRSGDITVNVDVLTDAPAQGQMHGG
ncbi:copper chaperone PCu(A)C [Pseudomonas typographi]|uniref:copper chaperone PCu(A)C n=1 Tax=Pseudomonas typographi TaxID=2715964 RepID=UPI001686931C|nr:copper chaperone PCu(A)C [Pseudomonas typographi]MBD1554325.1 copper chaperone PCu(A)C [Pseudomonas typographi]MBD1589389.1 copper chaperone PCu(A)C [Pseudomonas typographi]